MSGIRLAAAAGLLVLLAACGGGDGGPGPVNGGGGASPPPVANPGSTPPAPEPNPSLPEGSLRVALGGGQACGFDHVWVTVEGLRAIGDGGVQDIALAQPRRIDLMALTGGVLEELRVASLPAGHYGSLELVLGANASAGTGDPANAVQPAGQGVSPLQTPAAAQGGINVPLQLQLAAEHAADVVLVFDACRSVVQEGTGGAYLLKPVITARPRTPVFAAAGAQLVNSTTAGDQVGPHVAALADGGYLVAWTQKAGDPAAPSDVYGQRFDRAGQKAGGELLLFQGATADALTALPDGNFALAMTTRSGAVSNVLAQRFTAAGALLGTAQAVIPPSNAPASGAADAIHALPGGGFLVTARSSDPRPPPFETYHAGRFDANGLAVGEPLLLRDTFGFGGAVSSTVLPNGNWVFAWKEILLPFSQLSNMQTFATVFDSADATLASININPNPSADETNPGTATLADGRFVLAWVARPSGPGATLPQIQLQVFDATGVASTPIISLQTPEILTTQDTRLTPLADGGFLLSVARAPLQGEDPSLATVVGQYFDATARAAGPLFDLGTGRRNLGPPFEPRTWSVAPLPDGGFVFTSGLPTEGSGQDIYQKRFAPVGF